MKIYVISDIVVEDNEKYNEYMKLVPETIKKYGDNFNGKLSFIITGDEENYAINGTAKIIPSYFIFKFSIESWFSSFHFSHFFTVSRFQVF